MANTASSSDPTATTSDPTATMANTRPLSSFANSDLEQQPSLRHHRRHRMQVPTTSVAIINSRPTHLLRLLDTPVLRPLRRMRRCSVMYRPTPHRHRCSVMHRPTRRHRCSVMHINRAWRRRPPLSSVTKSPETGRSTMVETAATTFLRIRHQPSPTKVNVPTMLR